MSTFAALLLPDRYPTRTPSPARLVPPVPLQSSPHLRRDDTPLQRKAACACGGGCPDCREELDGLHIQPNLAIPAPGDPFEQEADRVVEQVMGMSASHSAAGPLSSDPNCPAPLLQRRLADGDAEQQPISHERGSAGHLKEIVEEAHINSLSGGDPLPESVRTFFEPRFGYDFSGVRIDTGPRAAQVASAINARAYTLGNYIAFAPGQYAPGTEQGNRLLAHELTHTVQQASAPTLHRNRLSGTQENDEESILTGTGGATGKVMRAPAARELAATSIPQRTPRLLVQREPDDESLQETAGKITERGAEREWSRTSAGITEQEKPGEKFLVMNFATGQADLKPEHKAFLQATVYFGALTSDPMAKIVLVGHADSTGEKKFNLRLSKKRAQEVEKFLRSLGRHNLRIESPIGKGVDEPIADNGSVFGRARNRGVEILLTPWKPVKPVPELLTELQKGMKPFVVKVDNFTACPFKDTVKSIVVDAFKSIPTIQFDWEGKSAGAEAFITFDDTSTFKKALGLSGDIFLNSFKENEVCKVPGDVTTCEKVFPATADIMGRAIANTVAHETGHAFALDHVPGTDNYMWSPELHPLNAKVNKTFQEKMLLQRDFQSIPETFNASQLVHIVNRIKEKRKAKPGVIEFE
jgi:outer membrane protein OmpA-like peptidoglycan-associated protein